MKQVMLALLACVFFIQTNAQSEVFITDGKAILGYDPVAFFTESKPVKGSAEFNYQYKNATWQFSCKENRDAFTKAPEKYAPQFGGYCAYGVSDGHKAPTETDTWTIVDDKLYFNYNKKVKEMWMKDQPHLIEVANQKWPEVKKM